ncbi:hypothetical protein [Pelosinus sp. sgz500959]|uniref:hypothetical protein n=1 Tax=Pelosinus sp. sgz500959 TaxID=3242472 RepID=UPI00366D7FB4
MHKEWLAASGLRFNNVYEDAIRQLRSDIGQAINEYGNRGTLHSSMFLGHRHRTVAATAKQLSQTRLDLDLNALKQKNFTVKDHTEQLISNQRTLLQEKLWKDYVLSDYKRNGLQKFATEWENRMWEELSHILHQAERLIGASALEHEPVSEPKDEPTTFINYGIYAIANDNGTVNATLINNNAEIKQLAVKLVELLKPSQLPAELKEEAIDLAETIADQASSGQPKKSILKAFGEKIKLIKDTFTGTDAMLHASQDLYNTASQLGELIGRSMS